MSACVADTHAVIWYLLKEILARNFQLTTAISSI